MNTLSPSIKRSNCYMVWGGEFSNSQQTRVSQEDFIVGCLVDLDTGLMTFTANGKEINTFYQVSRVLTLPVFLIKPQVCPTTMGCRLLAGGAEHKAVPGRLCASLQSEHDPV